ncbi:leucine-rich repeat domain-containing protein, partial [Flavobacterium davisii]
MKKIYFLLTALCLFMSVNAQIINDFDYRTLRRLLLTSTNLPIAKDIYGNNIKVDLNGDNKIDVSEALTVFELDLRPEIVPGFTGGDYILTLNGLENFVNIRKINCSTNPISLGWGSLNSLVNVEEIISDGNSSSLAINIHDLPHLKKMTWNHRNYLSGTQWAPSIILSNLPRLEIFECNYMGIALLDIANAPNLKKIVASNNNLASLNLVDFPSLEDLSVDMNKLTSINLTGLPLLKKLDVTTNLLTTLDVSAFSALEILKCSKNRLTTLIIQDQTNLKSLSCFSNNLTSINVERLSSLKNLNCENNYILSLNFQNSQNLEQLICRKNNLSTLVVTNVPNLVQLICDQNQITAFSLINVPNLVSLDCSHNQIKDLTIKNTNASIY